jgi:hypothetical protein
LDFLQPSPAVTDTLAGLRRIRNAQGLLAAPGASLAKRLLDAGFEFLSAARLDDDWPRELRSAADRIRTRLLAAGDLSSSIRTMDEATLDETAEELLLFAKRAQQLHACHPAGPRP